MGRNCDWLVLRRDQFDYDQFGNCYDSDLEAFKVIDSRAALEDNIGKFFKHRLDCEEIEGVADFYEQESSSLKLLLRAILRNRARIYSAYGSFPVQISVMAALCDWRDFTVELDSSGIPVLTQEIMEALKAAQ